MNKYIIPICDLEEVWILTIMARSTSACQDKIIENLTDRYDIEECNNYREFVQVADSKYNILIGDIKDIEEL
jgi:hypothetical protein